MQETQVPCLIGEDPTCLVATRPVHHSYTTCALEARSHNKRSRHNEKHPQSSPRSLLPEKGLQGKEDPAQPKGAKEKHTGFDIGFNVEFVLEMENTCPAPTVCQTLLHSFHIYFG